MSTLPVTKSGSVSAAATSSFVRVSADITTSEAIATTAGTSNSSQGSDRIGVLSSSAKIGVGVGVGVSALLLLIAVILFFLARRSYRSQKALGLSGGTAQDGSSDTQPKLYEKDGKPAQRYKPPVEIGGRDQFI